MGDEVKAERYHLKYENPVRIQDVRAWFESRQGEQWRHEGRANVDARASLAKGEGVAVRRPAACCLLMAYVREHELGGGVDHRGAQSLLNSGGGISVKARSSPVTSIRPNDVVSSSRSAVTARYF